MPAKCDFRLTHQDADRFMCAVRFWVSALCAAIRPVPVHDVDDTGVLKSRVSPLGWWGFVTGVELCGHVRGVSLPVLGWAIA